MGKVLGETMILVENLIEPLEEHFAEMVVFIWSELVWAECELVA